MKCKICGSESGSYPLCRTCYAKREAGEIIKCVKCGSWHYAGSPCHCEEGFQASRTSSEAELPFLYEAKPSLVTKTETAYLNCIKSFLPDTCLIQAQANLASFIRRTDGAKYQNELFRNVDFIITDLSYRPLLVIEINDQTHRLPERRERDKKVACICEEAGIPLINLWTSYGVNEEYIKKKITQTLASLPVERIHPLCPCTRRDCTAGFRIASAGSICCFIQPRCTKAASDLRQQTDAARLPKGRLLHRNLRLWLL